MSTLFIDTSCGLTLGLADENWNWKQFERDQSTKNSRVLFPKINTILEKEGLEAKDLSGLIIGSGPGSYTGVRLAEGLAQIWEYLGVETYSFYHFELPFICGYESGVWYSRAFKGEMFCYSWDCDESEKELVAEEDFSKKANDKDMFTFEIDSPNIVSTIDLIKNNGPQILSYVWERKKKLAPYYYRPPEKEFRPSMN